MRRLPSRVIIGSAAGAVVAGLLVGGVPAQATPTYGILVTAAVIQQTWLANPTNRYEIDFRAQPGMVESDIGVRRVGDSLVVFEENGGPSLGVADTTFCRSASASGPSSEVTCTFPSPVVANSDWVAVADFSGAPRAATFIIEEGSYVRAEFTGSAFDDYFQGGDAGDYADGGPGGDDLFGGLSGDNLWGGEGDDHLEGEEGPDGMRGGPGNDTLDGGPDADSMIGGIGADTLMADDKTADLAVDCGDPYARQSTGFEQGNKAYYDAKLDYPIDCGTREVPTPVAPPSISTTSVKVGETITGNLGVWRGATPIKYSYSFERCPFNLRVWPECKEIVSGSLDAKGLVNGKPPAYTVTKADRGYSLRFTVEANNEAKQGGGATTASSAPSDPVAKPASLNVPPYWLPERDGSKWSFMDVDNVRRALETADIAPFTDVQFVPVKRASVDQQYRKAVTHGGVVQVKVNGKVFDPGTRMKVEAAADERATIVVTYYSWFEDRKTCPVTDQGVGMFHDMAADDGLLLSDLTTWLNYVGCPWAVDWSEQVSSRPLITVGDVRIVSTDDPSQPVEMRITAKQPAVSAGLTMLVGAPPNARVMDRPEEFGIAVNGNLYAFPNGAQTSIWAALVGDQFRDSAKRGNIELYFNGERVLQETFGTSAGETPFSTVATYGFPGPGSARLVITTMADNTGVLDIPESQVFMDFTVVSSQGATARDLMTWDGRCFTSAGLPGYCSDTEDVRSGEMQEVLAQSGSPGLRAIRLSSEALRTASADLGRRFVVQGVNMAMSSAMMARTTRMRDCSGWWDIVCHASNFVEGAVQAVMKPRATKQVPKPPKKRYRIFVRVSQISPSSPMGGVVGGGLLRVPGLGLIGLDGGTLIGLDGGTFLSDLGVSLIGLDGGTLIGLDGGTLIGLDGGTLIGLDGGTLIGLDGGTLIGLDGGTVAVAYVSVTN